MREMVRVTQLECMGQLRGARIRAERDSTQWRGEGQQGGGSKVAAATAAMAGEVGGPTWLNKLEGHHYGSEWR
ncbi:hypothetical protein CRG98_004815 [Punica granatum]|uniref:Uncharacterized protein n=1 Tax=Punica granatum TaxID=22663 RepID=A0A2I0L263_PUNGR|nr:hypothetical protein CRG98_004815 [Punica granatum]